MAEDLPLVLRLTNYFYDPCINRFLNSEELMDLWNISSQWVGLRDISNHYAIILKNDVKE